MRSERETKEPMRLARTSERVIKKMEELERVLSMDSDKQGRGDEDRRESGWFGSMIKRLFGGRGDEISE
jgi:hypothetical protein